MAKLTISSLHLRSVVQRTVETLAEAETKSYVQVELRLRNSGRTKTLFFISRPRGIRYDRESRRLSLRFEEPDPATLIRPELRIPPRVYSLEPGCDMTLVVEVPLVLRTIRTSARADQAIVESDLSGVTSVACRIAYSETPFVRGEGEAAIDMVHRLYAWGERAELVVDESISPAAGNGDYPSQKGERAKNAHIE
jgi:hypothetical protein